MANTRQLAKGAADIPAQAVHTVATELATALDMAKTTFDQAADVVKKSVDAGEGQADALIAQLDAHFGTMYAQLEQLFKLTGGGTSS